MEFLHANKDASVRPYYIIYGAAHAQSTYDLALPQPPRSFSMHALKKIGEAGDEATYDHLCGKIYEGKLFQIKKWDKWCPE